MLYEKDYLLRQIQLLIQSLGKLLSRNDEDDYETSDPSNSIHLDTLHRRLIDLLAQNKFNEAENLLFEGIDTNEQKNFVLALDFYTRLNEFSDEILHKNNYTREEIKSGLEEVSRLFGFESIYNSIQI